MSCPTCKCKKKPCGCENQGLTTGSPCAQNTPHCPNPNPCAETFSTDCIIYIGDTILDLNFMKGDNLTRLLQKITLLFTNPACILPNSTCFSAINVHSTLINSTSIKLAWDENSVATGYVVEYKEASQLTWTLNPPVGLGPFPTDTISGLLPNTDYDIRVNSICAFGSCYSVTIRVTTTP